MQVTSSTFSYAWLNKQHNTSSFHFVCNMVTHIPYEYKLADISSKHWSHKQSYKNLINPLLHFYGDGDEYFMVNYIDLYHLSHDDFVALPICNSCELQFLSTGDFILEDGHTIGSDKIHTIELHKSDFVAYTHVKMYVQYTHTPKKRFICVCTVQPYFKEKTVFYYTCKKSYIKVYFIVITYIYWYSNCFVSFDQL